MCALFEIYSNSVVAIKEALSLPKAPNPGQFRSYSNIQIVVESPERHRHLIPAFWQFRMRVVDGQLKADRFPSFNSRWQDKTGGGFKPSFRAAYRESRCIIPASAFVEGMVDPGGTSKKSKMYHLLSYKSGKPILFGGLYKQWELDGELHYSASMITTGGHSKLKNIHPNAMPLILPEDSNTISMWLDSHLKETDGFTELMQPRIKQDMVAKRIKGFRETELAGDEFTIPKDC